MEEAVVEFSALLPQQRRNKIVKQVRIVVILSDKPQRPSNCLALSVWFYLQLRSGKVKVVISSDAAARGVDIPDLSAVIQVRTARLLAAFEPCSKVHVMV